MKPDRAHAIAVFCIRFVLFVMAALVFCVGIAALADSYHQGSWLSMFTAAVVAAIMARVMWTTA